MGKEVIAANFTPYDTRSDHACLNGMRKW